MKLSSATTICGIMAHTKDRAVASVGLPALRIACESLTRQDQQNEVLSLLDQIRRETGWQISKLKDGLMIVWKLDSASGEQMESEPSLSKPQNLLETLKIHPYDRIYVRVMHNYVDVSEYQKSRTYFHKGDVIQVLRWENGWWQGSSRGHTGWIPGKYCELTSEDRKALFDLFENTVSLQRPNSGLEVAKEEITNPAFAGFKAQKAAPVVRRVVEVHDYEKLTRALKTGEEAVNLDRQSRYSEALDAYSETCELLESLLEPEKDLSVSEDDQIHLKAIVSTDHRRKEFYPIQANHNTSVIRILTGWTTFGV